MRAKSGCLLAGLVVALAGSAQGQEVAPIEGVWLTASLSEITISACETGYCGTISTIVVPEAVLAGTDGAAIAAMDPASFFDANNEDPALRVRPILGLPILTLVPTDEAHIYDGDIYNPEDGKTYSGYVEILGADMVRLNGCVLYNIICRGEDWTRVAPE